MTVSFFSAHQTPPRWDTASIADTVLRGRNTKSEDGRRDERLHLPFLAHTLILPEKQLHLKHHMCRQSSYDEKEKEKRLRDVGTQWKMGIISHSWVDGYNQSFKGRNLSHLARRGEKREKNLLRPRVTCPPTHPPTHTHTHPSWKIQKATPGDVTLHLHVQRKRVLTIFSLQFNSQLFGIPVSLNLFTVSVDNAHPWLIGKAKTSISCVLE